MAAAAAPLLIPQSRDPADTRPNTSGQIPAVHYNVPIYQGLPTQGSDPGTTAMGPIARTVAGVIGGGAHDIRANLNPLTTTGLVNLAGIFVPGKGLGKPTADQQAFLDAIQHSSFNKDMRQGRVYRTYGEGVTQLRDAIGEPPLRQGTGRTSSPDYTAAGNALQYVRGQGDYLTGMHPGETDPKTIYNQQKAMAWTQRFFQGIGSRENPTLDQMKNNVINNIKRGDYLHAAYLLRASMKRWGAGASDIENSDQAMMHIQNLHVARTAPGLPGEMSPQTVQDFLDYMQERYGEMKPGSENN